MDAGLVYFYTFRRFGELRMINVNINKFAFCRLGVYSAKHFIIALAMTGFTPNSQYLRI